MSKSKKTENKTTNQNEKKEKLLNESAILRRRTKAS